MIRKAIIVVLTLVALAVAAGSLMGDPRRTHIYDIDPGKQQAVGIVLSRHELILMFFKIDEPPKPDVRNSYWIGGLFRGRMFTNPGGVYIRTCYALSFPPAVPVLLLVAYPAVAFFRGPVRCWHRRRNGLCLTCGYDLTGNVSRVCPECGTATGHCPSKAIGPSPSPHEDGRSGA